MSVAPSHNSRPEADRPAATRWLAQRAAAELRCSAATVERCLASLIGFQVMAFTACSLSAQPGPVPAPCSSEVTAVIAASLRHALVDARDLPDLLIVERRDPVYVLDYVWGTECLVDEAILPTSSNRTYALLDRDEAQAMANQRGEALAFVRAGEIKVVEREASVFVGAAIRPADGGERGLTCCCGGQMFLRLEGEAWTFARWGDIYCA